MTDTPAPLPHDHVIFEDHPEYWMTAQDRVGQTWAFIGGPGVFHGPSGRWIVPNIKPWMEARALPMGMEKKSAEPGSTRLCHGAHKEECLKAQREWEAKTFRPGQSNSPKAMPTVTDDAGFGGNQIFRS